jgi:hypothetical protein
MKSTIDLIAAPPFHPRNELGRKALKEWTIARLWLLDEEADAGRRYDLLLTPEGRARTQYAVAKSSARYGNLEALRAFLVSLLRDPEIAEFIAEPRRPRGQRRPRQNIDMRRYWRRQFRNDAAATVQRIRKMWCRQFGKFKRNDDLALDIAAEYHGLTVDEVVEALKRRTRMRRTAK